MGLFKWGNTDVTYEPDTEYFEPVLIPDDASSSYAWKDFTLYCRTHWRNVIRFECLMPAYYKATCSDGTVIFFTDKDDYRTDICTPDQAQFNSEQEWRREFAKRLTMAMRYKGINQEQLAELTGYSQSSISAYLTRKKAPSSYVIREIARVLSTTTEFLIGF